jgi:hypothetical protein
LRFFVVVPGHEAVVRPFLPLKSRPSAACHFRLQKTVRLLPTRLDSLSDFRRIASAKHASRVS